MVYAANSTGRPPEGTLWCKAFGNFIYCNKETCEGCGSKFNGASTSTMRGERPAEKETAEKRKGENL